jgi:two-component system OmpR family response regulator
MGRHISICVGDQGLLRRVSTALTGHGFAVETLDSAAEAMRVVPRSTPQVLVLDVAVPDADGRDLCHALRAAGIDTPVLFLGCAGTPDERISGFNAGGDDYLGKPFADLELVARVGALARRRTHAAPAGDALRLTFDPVTLSVGVAGHSTVLAPSEYRLLAALTSRRGGLIGRNDLLAIARLDERGGDDAEFEGCVTRLRQKLDEIEARETIEVSAGTGYRLR